MLISNDLPKAYMEQSKLEIKTRPFTYIQTTEQFVILIIWPFTFFLGSVYMEKIASATRGYLLVRLFSASVYMREI